MKFKSIKTLPKNMFRDSTSLESITIPSGIEEIGSDAFNSCDSLKTCILPEGVKTIEDGMFFNCHLLNDIRIPDSVEEIREEAFYNCYSLKNCILPKSIKIIGVKSFYGCESLSDVYIPDCVEELGEKVFADCTGIRKFSLGKKLFERLFLTIINRINEIIKSEYYTEEFIVFLRELVRVDKNYKDPEDQLSQKVILLFSYFIGIDFTKVSLEIRK